ncbi:MAG: dienelactone hydrolase family protein [Chitinophagaceae bacterium]|nr:dienelactone hydrolase family protein [Chitinophagaceae bacterium]
MTACNNEEKKPDTPAETAVKEPKIKEDNVTYTGDNISMSGFVAYDENKEGPRPAVIVVPEWWGLNDYPKHRAKQLAELGYIAIAIDMYGNGKTADNPDSAGKYATPFYQDPQMAKRRFEAALEKLKSYSQTDTSKIAAIGYCFGGAQVLNMARLGENLKGVVSFHGNLMGVPADKNTLKAAILVCHGAADTFVPANEVALFKKEMEKVGANYTFKAYDSATHAFTNPDATEAGKKFKLPIAYNAAADSASWNDMKSFFNRIFQ